VYPYERPEPGRGSSGFPWYEVITIVVFSGQAILTTMYLHRYGFSWGRGILALGSAALVLGACGTLMRRGRAKTSTRES